MRSDPSRWTFVALLLFAGARMIVDPDSIGRLGQNATKGIRNFERALRSDSWPTREVDAPVLPKTPVRLAGLVVIAIGLLAATVE